MAHRLPALPLLTAVLGLLAGCEPTSEPRAIPLVHSAYVWKQGWNVRAMAGLAPEVIPAAITELNVLVGECGLSGGTRAIRVPWPAVAASGRRAAVSVRVGYHRAASKTPFDNLDQGLELVRRGLEAAKAAGVEVGEAQVDFDCPTRLLSDYATWIKAAKGRLPGIRITITTLPTWLDSPDFAGLADAADGWTLQVHGTEPASLKDPKPLIDAERTLGWIRKANRLNRPYRVALPTYSYLACFNAKGRYLGMRAEGVGLPDGTTRCVHLPADPEQVAKVLRSLQDDRNGLVQAVDWYRLPLPGEAQIWTTKGLGEVIAGKRLDGDLKTELRRQGALTDILLHNPTEQPLPIPSVSLTWQAAMLEGSDSTLMWEARRGDGEVVFQRHPAAGFLPPGKTVVVGWVRLSEDKEPAIVVVK